MGLENATRQKTKQMELPLEGKGEAPINRRSVEALTATYGNERLRSDDLMGRVVAEENVKSALCKPRWETVQNPTVTTVQMGKKGAILTKQ